jgi:hypothetical protein
MSARVISITSKTATPTFKTRLTELHKKPTQRNLLRALALLNTRHVAIKVGAKHCVCDITVSHQGVLPQHKSDFKEQYRTYVFKDFSGRERSLGEIWLDWPERRAHLGRITFAPPGAPIEEDDDDNYNTWRGFRLEAKPGDWSLFRAHLRDIVCQGHDDWFDALVDGFAHMVQFPGKLPGVCWVIRGKQGTGKTIVYDSLQRIFRRFNRALLDNPKQVVGNFNMHLAEKVLVCADEAVFARAKDTVGKLKSLITQPEQRFEAKGFDLIEMLNVTRLLIISNDAHVFHAAADERRYFVLETKNTYAQQPGESLEEANRRRAAYFDPITRQLDSGGAEAMLYDLQRRDLRDYKPLKFPDTPYLNDQKILSLEPHEKWLYDLVMDGHKWFTDQTDTNRPSKIDVHSHYRTAAKDYTGKTPLRNAVWLGRFLADIFGVGVGTHKRTYYGLKGKRTQVTVYWFPPLAEAQQKLLTYLGISGGKLRVRIPKKVSR